MDYCLLSWLIGVIQLILSVFTVLSLICVGYAVIKETVNSTLHPLQLFVHWCTFIVSLILTPLCVVACLRLIRATETVGNPAFAVELCQLWWILNWVSRAISIPIFIVETFVKEGTFHPKLATCTQDLETQSPPDLETQSPPQNSKVIDKFSKIIVALIDFIIQIITMFCVYNFMREMKSVFPLSTKDSILTQQLAQQYTEQNITSSK